MTMTTLGEIEERTKKATAGPWRLGGPGIIGGVEYVTSNVRTDGDAAFIAASRADVPLLTSVIRAVEKLHWREFRNNKPSTCHEDGKHWPCPTITAIREALT